jgi:xylan 1,4-beta-xylosidase
MSTSWNLKDGIYGMMDQDNNLRPSATVFTWANKYLVGDVAKATTNQPSVEVLAVHQPDQSHSLLLVNKGAKPAKLNIKTTNQLSAAELFRLDAQGTSKDSLTSDKEPLVLPAYSLALLHFKN